MGTGNHNNAPTAFQSPLPLLEQVRRIIFGNKEPDNYTKLTFFVVLFYWLIFTVWSLAFYLTISYRQLIMEQKRIPVEKIIEQRGQELGFAPHEFLSRLQTIQSIALICWTSVLLGLILLWRKKSSFIYFIAGGLLFYTGMLMFYMNYSYFKEDITLFDKIGLLICAVMAGMYYLMLKREKEGGSLSFFEEDPNDE